MEKKSSSIAALVLSALLCVSFIPQASASSEAEVTHHAFGVEYDYSNLNEDFEAMTGLPLDEILGDIMQSADDAGIDLLILEEITGTSNLIIDQYEDGHETIYTEDGNPVQLTRHVTDLTIRHGVLADTAIITEWSDARAGWDLTFSTDSENIFNLDAHYVELRDAEGLIYGHDMIMSLNYHQDVSINLDGSLEANDGDDTLPLNIAVSMGVDYEISNAESSVSYDEPSEIYQEISDLEGGQELHWEIDDDEQEYYNYGDEIHLTETNVFQEGDFTTSTGFNFELTGLPADEFGMPEGHWDISATDSTTDTGTFEDDFECEMYMALFEGTQTITYDDGQEIEVMQAHTSPLPFAMNCQIAHLFINAFEGSEDAATLEDMLEESVDEIEDSFENDGDGYGEGDKITLDVYSYSPDEIEAYYSVYGTDTEETYELTMILTDSDGVTQDSYSDVLSGDYYYWDELYMSSGSWGEHCLTASLKQISTGEIVDQVDACFNIAQELEPSDLLMTIVE